MNQREPPEAWASSGSGACGEGFVIVSGASWATKAAGGMLGV